MMDKTTWIVAAGALLLCGSVTLVAVAQPAEKTIIQGKVVTPTGAPAGPAQGIPAPTIGTPTNYQAPTFNKPTTPPPTIGKPTGYPTPELNKPAGYQPPTIRGGTGAGDCRAIYQEKESCKTHIVVNVTGENSCKAPETCKLYENIKSASQEVTPGSTCREAGATYSAKCVN